MKSRSVAVVLLSVGLLLCHLAPPASADITSAHPLVDDGESHDTEFGFADINLSALSSVDGIDDSLENEDIQPGGDPTGNDLSEPNNSLSSSSSSAPPSGGMVGESGVVDETPADGGAILGASDPSNAVPMSAMSPGSEPSAPADGPGPAPNAAPNSPGSMESFALADDSTAPSGHVAKVNVVKSENAGEMNANSNNNAKNTNNNVNNNGGAFSDDNPDTLAPGEADASNADDTNFLKPAGTSTDSVPEAARLNEPASGFGTVTEDNDERVGFGTAPGVSADAVSVKSDPGYNGEEGGDPLDAAPSGSDPIKAAGQIDLLLSDGTGFAAEDEDVDITAEHDEDDGGADDTTDNLEEDDGEGDDDLDDHDDEEDRDDKDDLVTAAANDDDAALEESAATLSAYARETPDSAEETDDSDDGEIGDSDFLLADDPLASEDPLRPGLKAKAAPARKSDPLPETKPINVAATAPAPQMVGTDADVIREANGADTESDADEGMDAEAEHDDDSTEDQAALADPEFSSEQNGKEEDSNDEEGPSTAHDDDEDDEDDEDDDDEGDGDDDDDEDDEIDASDIASKIDPNDAASFISEASRMLDEKSSDIDTDERERASDAIATAQSLLAFNGDDDDDEEADDDDDEEGPNDSNDSNESGDDDDAEDDVNPGEESDDDKHGFASETPDLLFTPEPPMGSFADAEPRVVNVIDRSKLSAGEYAPRPEHFTADTDGAATSSSPSFNDEESEKIVEQSQGPLASAATTGTSIISHATRGNLGVDCEVCESVIEDAKRFIFHHDLTGDKNPTAISAVCAQAAAPQRSACVATFEKFGISPLAFHLKETQGRDVCTSFNLCDRPDITARTVEQRENALREVIATLIEGYTAYPVTAYNKLYGHGGN